MNNKGLGDGEKFKVLLFMHLIWGLTLIPSITGSDPYEQSHE